MYYYETKKQVASPMPNELIHLFGPLSINSFGLLAALGLLAFYWLIQKHPQFAALHLENTFTTILLLGAGVGILGGKILYRISEADAVTPVSDLFAFWTGGISVLGATLALLIVIPLYLRYKKIPILPFADLVCIHIPLFQAIARLGCFFAGCCFGASTHVPWAVTYTDPGCYAPLYKSLHPTQLYSALFLFGIFLLMYFVLQYVFKKPGELLCAYLMLMSSERFIVDFWRADRVFFASPALHVLSIYQWVAIGIFLGASIGLLIFKGMSLPAVAKAMADRQSSSGGMDKKVASNKSENSNKMPITVRPACPSKLEEQSREDLRGHERTETCDRREQL